ncbi:hypothetical protein HanIR_Chr11g0508411 [Helianthus annuus]|nr:hypothetical protein HanIR_Chr11g0508411 [Helianthus annuus]
MALFNHHEWYYTPSQHESSQQQQHPRDPSEDPHFTAVTPPPPPPVQPVMPDPPRRRRTNARMSVGGGGIHFSTPRHSSASHCPTVQEEEGSSSPAQETNSAPVARNPPPFGNDRQVPPYATAYNPYEPTSHAHYNYDYERDPYVVAARYGAHYPDRAHGPTRAPDYSAHGYPAPPRPPVPQPQPRFSHPEQEEILQRLDRVEREFEEEKKSHRGFLKGLANLLKGKKKKRDH